MDGRALECTEVEKDRGVFVDKEFRFERHVNKMSVKKANEIVLLVGMITQCIKL